MIPINAKNGAKLVGLSSLIQKASPSSPDKLKIQLVTVVPTLEPMMIPTA